MSHMLVFHAAVDALPQVETRMLLGRRARLLGDEARALLPPGTPPRVWEALVARGDPGDDGRCATTWIDGEPPLRLLAAVLPEACSRYNAPSRAWAIPKLAGALAARRKASLVAFVEEDAHAHAVALALGRAFPTYHAGGRAPREVHVVVLGPSGPVAPASLAVLAEAVQRAAHHVDQPPNELDTLALVAAARAVADAHRGTVRMEALVGEAVREAGLGGLWGVGKAAQSPPALVVLDHEPPGAEGHDAWVGKGIVFDTGGLSLKSKTGMPGMKTDMAGAAAVLAAFDAAVRLGARRRLTAVLCLAENAVGPGATRPDDVLRLYSGRTVEVNNTDAEGRLVLADGLAWVARNRRPRRVIDVATLTGAQATATGKLHAAVVSDDEDLERDAVEAGRATGDLCHPLPFAPELHLRELRSSIADLKNSVKDRDNAQSSCAATFVREHLGEAALPWLHVDMAGPATSGGRGTGFGVGLLLRLAGVA